MPPKYFGGAAHTDAQGVMFMSNSHPLCAQNPEFATSVSGAGSPGAAQFRSTPELSPSRMSPLRRWLIRAGVVAGISAGAWLGAAGVAGAQTVPAGQIQDGGILGGTGIDLNGTGVDDLVAPVAELVAPVTDVVAPVVDPVKAAVKPVVKPVAEAVAPVVDAAKPVAHAVAPIAQVVEPVAAAAQPVVKAVAPVVEVAKPVVVAAAPVVEAVVEPVAAVAEPVTDAVTPAAENVVAPAVRAAAAPLEPVVQTVTRPVATAVHQASRPAATIVTAATKPVAGTVKAVATPVAQAVKSVTTPATRVVADALDAVDLRPVVHAIKIIDRVVSSQVAPAVDSVLTTVKDLVKSIVDPVVEAVTPALPEGPVLPGTEAPQVIPPSIDQPGVNPADPGSSGSGADPLVTPIPSEASVGPRGPADVPGSTAGSETAGTGTGFDSSGTRIGGDFDAFGTRIGQAEAAVGPSDNAAEMPDSASTVNARSITVGSAGFGQRSADQRLTSPADDLLIGAGTSHPSPAPASAPPTVATSSSSSGGLSETGNGKTLSGLAPHQDPRGSENSAAFDTSDSAELQARAEESTFSPD